MNKNSELYAISFRKILTFEKVWPKSAPDFAWEEQGGPRGHFPRFFALSTMFL